MLLLYLLQSFWRLSKVFWLPYCTGKKTSMLHRIATTCELCSVLIQRTNLYKILRGIAYTLWKIFSLSTLCHFCANRTIGDKAESCLYIRDCVGLAYLQGSHSGGAGVWRAYGDPGVAGSSSIAANLNAGTFSRSATEPVDRSYMRSNRNSGSWVCGDWGSLSEKLILICLPLELGWQSSTKTICYWYLLSLHAGRFYIMPDGWHMAL